MKTQIFILSTLLLFNCSNNETDTNFAPTAEDIALSLPEILTEDLLATVEATDANEDDVLTYSIVSQSPANAMTIDANDGRLFVNDLSAFDYERYENVTAVVAITDGELTTSINVEITLLDVPGPDGNLLAYFSLNGNGNDSSLNQFNGVPSSSGLIPVPNRFGKLNSAYQFNDGRVIIPSFGTNNSNFTISAWVYHDSNLGTLLGDRTIIAKAGAGREYVMKLQNQYANAHFYTNAYFNATSDVTMPANTWFNYTLKVEGTTWKIFKDGILIKSSTHATSNPWGTNSVVIGALTGTGNEPFNGKIDDVLFYSRALTDNEILAIANNVY